MAESRNANRQSQDTWKRVEKTTIGRKCREIQMRRSMRRLCVVDERTNERTSPYFGDEKSCVVSMT